VPKPAYAELQAPLAHRDARVTELKDRLCERDAETYLVSVEKETCSSRCGASALVGLAKGGRSSLS
jgi:hypothetical protein